MQNIDAYYKCIASYSDLHRLRTATYIETLSKANPILQQWRERDRLRPPNFNIFHALGHAYREVSTHSALLAHLLDPAGSHAQRANFLCKFFDVVQAAANRQCKNLTIPPVEDPALWSCRKEARLSYGLGQADVLIRGPGLILIIENKIHAGDQDCQIQRYWRFLAADVDKKKALPVVVYLTPDGRPPSSYSTQDSAALENNLVLLSYSEDIHHFVERSLETVAAVSVAEVLRQYGNLVRGLK